MLPSSTEGSRWTDAIGAVLIARLRAAWTMGSGSTFFRASVDNFR